MRRVSVRRAELIATVEPERQAFRESWAWCWICGEAATDIHEIARGCHRAQSLAERCNWIRCCRSCHADLSDYGRFPVVWQYALKLIWDQDFYDRIRINELRGRASEAVTDAEVREVMQEVFARMSMRALTLSVALRP